MVQNQIIQIDSESPSWLYQRRRQKLTKGNHMKREPIDVGSAQNFLKKKPKKFGFLNYFSYIYYVNN